MISKKLEKIARQYRIDPDTLPHVDGKSATVNISPPPPPSTPITPFLPSREARIGERERLRAEMLAAKQRLADYIRLDRERQIAAKRETRK